MKHKMWSRLLSMMLAVMMIASIVPNSAFAEAASEIAASSQAAVEVVEETEEVTLPEEEVPASEAPAEETPAVEPTAEPAPTEEPVAEPAAEPVTESEQPAAEPTQAPAETVAPSEEPSAEPTAAPEGTETPEGTAVPSETPAASATPAPSESPVPSETPAPSEEPAIDGQALLDELMAIEDDEAFLKAVGELTEEQTAALEALGEEALVEYAQRVESLTAAKQQDEKFTELYDKLMAAETLDDFYALLDALSDEEFELFDQWLSEEQNQEIVERVAALLEIGDGEVQEEEKDNDFISPVNFANVAPLSALSAMTPMRAMRTMRAAQTTTPAQNPDGLEMTKSIRKDDSGKYWIDLEAYTTGTITSSGGDPVPADIVLVLDMSGSMDYCMNCGKEQKDHHGDGVYCKEGEYVKVYDVQPGGEYYYGYSKDKAYWCNSCNRWFSTDDHYWHDYSFYQLTPKTYENGRGTQFYEYRNDGTKFEPRIDALKNAVNGFITSVKDDAIKYKVDHKISLVKFSGDTSKKVGNDTYSDRYSNKWNYSQIVKNLTPVSSGAEELKAAVNGLKPNGGTRTDNGLKKANEVFKGGAVEERNRIVVLFTDGEPTGINSNNTFDDSVANNAISEAKTLKKEKGATVYTIGVFSGADGANPANLPPYNEDRNNRFMHLVSSNYPDATKVKPDDGWYGDENTGELNPKLEGTDKSYYLSAGDSETLNKIFQDISDEIQGGGSSFKLDDKAVIKDVMSDYFQLPVGTNKDDVTVEYYKADYSGGDLQWTEDTTYHPGITKTVDQATGSVSVTGFDFDHNFVTDKGRVEGDVEMSGDFYGRKIKISFPVEVKPEFLGGNNVLTNSETASGIYKDASEENPVGVFASPNLNVPVKANVQKVDQTIHLTTSITADQLFEQTITPNGTNNAYVTITYTVKDSQGNVLGTYTIQQGQTDGSWSGGAAPSISPDECSNYTITCTVTPNAGKEDSCKNPAVEADEKEANSTVHVLYPTVQAKDKYIALGESTDFDKCWNHAVVNWYDVNAEHTNNPAPVTTAPEVIDVKVKVVNSSGDEMVSGTTVSPTKDTDYNIVAVKLGTGETGWITDAAKFAVLEDKTTKHNADEHTCIQPTEDDQSQNPHDFTIHVYSVNGDLKIKKTLQSFNASKGDDAVFTFKAVNDDTQQVYYATIPFQKDEFVNGGSVTHETTLKGIPAGTYTVYELTSAGYVAVGVTEVKDVAVGGAAAGCAEFTNKSDNNKTPGDNSSVLNKWLGDTFAPVTSEAANG